MSTEDKEPGADRALFRWSACDPGAPRGGQKHENGRGPGGESPANEEVCGSGADPLLTRDSAQTIQITICRSFRALYRTRTDDPLPTMEVFDPAACHRQVSSPRTLATQAGVRGFRSAGSGATPS